MKGITYMQDSGLSDVVGVSNEFNQNITQIKQRITIIKIIRSPTEQFSGSTLLLLNNYFVLKIQ